MTTKSFKLVASQRVILKSIKMKLMQSKGNEYTCNIILGNKNEIKITTDNNLINDLLLEHQSETTTISYNGSVNLQPTKIHVDIYTDKVSFISVAGVCSVRIDGQIKTDDFVIDLSTASKLIAEHGVNISKGAINLSGASSIQMKHAKFNELIIDIAGGTKLELEGSSTILSGEFAGASTADLDNFAVETFKGEISGASTCRLYSTKSIRLDVSGASKATVHGSCVKADFDVSGASSLNASNLKAKDVTIDASGSSQAHVYASEALRAESSGASSVKYSGSPSKVSKDKSGASSIRSSK